jgi:hypothetical protein
MKSQSQITTRSLENQTMFKLTQVLAAFALMFAFTAATQAAGIISVSITLDGDTSGGGLLSSSELAGAPGVRVDNWNNLINGAPLDNTATDNDGVAIGGSFAVSTSIGSGIYSDRDGGGLTNDREMFSGVIDVFTSASATVTDVPFGLYDVYVYMRDDADTRGGSFTIDGQTVYLRGGVGNPDASGNGYVLSTDTTFGAGTDIQQGNYVVIRGLTASNFTLTANAVNTGDNVTRNKWPGFQIVAVPTPAALPAGLALLGALILRRRAH